eukprot:1159279-Pelagomonas_calceolata.AAC.5
MTGSSRQQLMQATKKKSRRQRGHSLHNEGKGDTLAQRAMNVVPPKLSLGRSKAKGKQVSKKRSSRALGKMQDCWWGDCKAYATEPVQTQIKASGDQTVAQEIMKTCNFRRVDTEVGVGLRDEHARNYKRHLKRT